MDYNANKHFFDKEYNKKTNMVFVPASIVFAIGLILVILSLIGALRMYMVGHFVGWPLMIVSIVFIFISLSRRVTENDVLAETDALVNEVKSRCSETLDYPSDLDPSSLTILGCVITAENADKAVKLKSGNYLDTDLKISFLYVKKTSVYCFQRTVSLVQEGVLDVEREIPFSAFDRACVETETVNGKITVHYIRFYNGSDKIFEAPLSDNDYYKEEFCTNIMHKKDRF